LDVHDLYLTSTSPSPSQTLTSIETENEKTTVAGSDTAIDNTTATNGKSTGSVYNYKQLAIDTCDLFMIGGVLRWIPMEPVWIGVLGSISGTLGMHSVWQRVGS
jgi:hypothetical protein